MKIEIKNIKVIESLSEETICFTADIFVNSKKVGYAKNSGRGGCTDYKPYKTWDILHKADAFLKTLPSTKYVIGDRAIDIESNLENFIDFAVEEFQKKKSKAQMQKKLNKSMLTNIVFGKPDGETYRSLGFGQKFTILALTTEARHTKNMQTLVDTVKKAMKEGDVVLNTNFDPKEFGL